MVSFENLNRIKVVHFFNTLCNVKERLDESKLAKRRLDDKIESVKGIYTNEKPKLPAIQIVKEFEELKEYVADFVEKEKNLMVRQQKGFITKNEFRNKLAELEKKINAVLNLKSKGHKRIEELNKKVGETIGNKPESIKRLKSRIKSLEQHYKNLQKEDYNKGILGNIKKRILYLKGELKEL